MAPPRAPKVPCGTCPYRKDVPSGIWHSHEYEKLPVYDGDILDQVLQGGTALFLCHQKDGCLCGGWLQTHGVDDLVALRLHEVDLSVWNYSTTVECFASGAEACAHGKAEIDEPSPAAKRKIAGLVRKRGWSDAQEEQAIRDLKRGKI